MARILVTRPVPDSTIEILRAGLTGPELDHNREERQLSAKELLERAIGCDALLCTLRDAVDACLLEALVPPLHIVANFAVGVDNIDLAAAKRLGVAVTNTPGVLTEATAETAVGLMLACARRFVEGDRIMRQDRFEGWAPLLHLGQPVYGRTVGIVGAGRIGKRVAATMRRGFDCDVLYHSPRDHPELDARRVPLDELLASSDFVSLHCPLNEDTHHLLDRRRLALLRPTAVLVNTSRGPVVDEEALVECLREGRIAGAGLDVYEREPALAAGLAALDNVILLPHAGSATLATRSEMGRLAAESIVDVLSGREPQHRVV
ncbi:MAG: 2-hydroxyacid dehydrogenase [Planctomycetota bacterium]|jgi:glyoxylate reductase